MGGSLLIFKIMKKKKIKIDIFSVNLDSITVLIGREDEMAKIPEVKKIFAKRKLGGGRTFTSSRDGMGTIWVLINTEPINKTAELDEILVHELQLVIDFLSEKYQITDTETKAYTMMYLWKKTKDLVKSEGK